MMRALRPLLFGCLVVLPLPAVAGQAYVPFVTAYPANADSSPSTAPNLQLYNLGSVGRRFTVRFLAAGATGPGDLIREGTLSPRISIPLPCCDQSSGVLVVSGAPQVAVSAQFIERLEPTDSGVLTHLPVITARDTVPAGGSALLQGLLWTPGGPALGVTSSLGILNLGTRSAHCSVTGFGAAAPSFADLLDLVVPASGLAAFPDVIGQRIGSPDTGSFSPSPTVTCDQPFYPFAINYRGGTLPSLEIVTPSVMLGSAP